MSKQFDYLVFIGRFQPWHKGHQRVLDKAFELAEKVIIVIGSADEPRTAKNPFTVNERISIIKSAQIPVNYDRIFYVGERDYSHNNQKWIAEVQAAVYAISLNGFKPNPVKIGLIGHDKDNSSFYLNLFPEWEKINVEQPYMVNATDIRNSIYGGWTPTVDDTGLQPWAINQNHQNYVLLNFNALPPSVEDEYWKIKEYKDSWKAAPYPPIFVTVDAVVVQAGFVLVVKRGASPGKGQLALPGGFLNQEERLEDGMLRELREETKIKVPDPVLRGSIVKREVFDNPYRSQRGRTITNAFYLKLHGETLPKIKGSDDAVKAFWMPLAEVKAKRDQFFEDHWEIIDVMVGL